MNLSLVNIHPLEITRRKRDGINMYHLCLDFGDDTLNDQIEDEPTRVAFDDFLFDLGTVRA
jgi:hypothetical protein